MEGCQGRTISLDVDPTHTISDIKQMIHSAADIPSDSQIFEFSGCVLQNACTLEEAHVLAQSTLHVGVCALGGGSQVRARSALVILNCTNLTHFTPGRR